MRIKFKKLPESFQRAIHTYFLKIGFTTDFVNFCSRNLLKSGQCFLQHPSFLTHYRKLNPPFSGTSLFL